MGKAFDRSQLKYFLQDLKRMLGKYKIRIVHIWLSRGFVGILKYRIERSLFLILGKYYSFLRVLFVPILNLLDAYSNLDLNYKAEIGPGLLILHPSVGVVVSGLSKIGSNLTLTGGNIIGAKAGCQIGGILIGDNCLMGANAVIIGPLKIGDNVTIGASALVIKDFSSNVILIGVPAIVKNKSK